MKKYLNDMTPAEQAAEQAAYAIRLVAWTERRDERNRAGMAATGLKHGDSISYYTVGFGGMPNGEIRGKVIHDRNGYLVARFPSFGNRSLNTSMKKV